MKNSYKVIAFDADDTLWVNEPYYRETENAFYKLLSDFIDQDTIEKEFFKTEMNNLSLYGYGAKALTLSMVETAVRVSHSKVSAVTINAIINLGRDLINKPVVLLDGVEQVLKTMRESGIPIIVVTKGDLLDQQRKLINSGLEQYFHHVEIVSDKKEKDYLKLIQKLNIVPEDLLMIGNSRKSDVIPVVNIGGYAAFVPYHTSWQHEEAPEIESDHCIEVKSIHEVLNILS